MTQFPVASCQNQLPSYQFGAWQPPIPIPRSISYSLCAFPWVSVFVPRFVVAKLAAIRPNRACSAWIVGWIFHSCIGWPVSLLWQLKWLDYFWWPSAGNSPPKSYLPIIVCV